MFFFSGLGILIKFGFVLSMEGVVFGLFVFRFSVESV